MRQRQLQLGAEAPETTSPVNCGPKRPVVTSPFFFAESRSLTLQSRAEAPKRRPITVAALVVTLKSGDSGRRWLSTLSPESPLLAPG